MSRQRTMKATVPLLWVVAILAGVFAFVASNQSQDALGTTTQVFAYPGPVAGPGVPRGPGLGTITIGDSRSGWVGGFSANSQVCYTIDGQDAGCGLTVDRGEVGYAFFVLSIGNNCNLKAAQTEPQAVITCPGKWCPTAQINGGPVVRVHLGVNTMVIKGTKTIKGVRHEEGITLSFTVVAPPCSSTTTTVPNGSTTTTAPNSSTTTTPGSSTTSTSNPNGSTTTSPNSSTTTTSPNSSTTTPGGSTIPPSFSVGHLPLRQAAKFAALVGALAALTALALGLRGGFDYMSPVDDGGEFGFGEGDLAPIDDGGEGGLAPVDDGGEAGQTPVDDGGEAGQTPVDDGGEAPVDDGGEQQTLDDGGEEPIDDGGEEPIDDGGEEPIDDGGEEQPIDDGDGDDERRDDRNGDN